MNRGEGKSFKLFKRANYPADSDFRQATIHGFMTSDIKLKYDCNWRSFFIKDFQAHQRFNVSLV